MNVFELDTCRDILHRYIEEQPRKGRGLIKAIAEFLNINASQVSQTLSGLRNFSDEHSFALTKFMGLRPLETDYFLVLSHADKAGSKDLRDYHLKRAQKIKASAQDLKKRLTPDRVLSDPDKSVFYSSYLYSAIRLATSIGDGQSVGAIAKMLNLPHPLVAEILTFLTEKGLCNEKDGVFTMGSQHTHIGRGSPYLVRHHHNWRVKALERAHLLTDKELQFTGPASVDEETFIEIRRALVEIIEKSSEKIKAAKSTELACLLIDWFRVT